MQIKKIGFSAIIVFFVSGIFGLLVFQNCSPMKSGYIADSQTQVGLSAQPGLPPSPSLPPSAELPPATPLPTPIPEIPSSNCNPNTFVSPLDKAGYSGGEKVNWSDVFGYNWPAPASTRVDWFLVPKMGYKALKFRVGPNPGNISGRISTVEDTGSTNLRFGSISTCPGDWNVIDACRHTWGISGGIKWSIEAKSGYCQLEKDTVYYLNISTVNTYISTAKTYMADTCNWTHPYFNQDYCTMFLQAFSQ